MGKPRMVRKPKKKQEQKLSEGETGPAVST
jgi:hypothetical protein